MDKDTLSRKLSRAARKRWRNTPPEERQAHTLPGRTAKLEKMHESNLEKDKEKIL